MTASPSGSRWPGIVATGFLVLATSLWTYWGVSEFFWEGWGLPFPQPLFYLAPAAIFLVLSVLALRFPLVGGLAVFVFGAAFTWWWWSLMYRRGANMLWAALTATPGLETLRLTDGKVMWQAGPRAGGPATGADSWHPAHNGAVQSQPKNFGNPRHGYRCVREVPAR